MTFFWCSVSIGQYANDWIDYSQKYYSFKIWQDGVYQIDHATMSAAGIPVLRRFKGGPEQRDIDTQDESSEGIFNA